jgi:hypothetical protein
MQGTREAAGFATTLAAAGPPPEADADEPEVLFEVALHGFRDAAFGTNSACGERDATGVAGARERSLVCLQSDFAGTPPHGDAYRPR